MNDSNIKFSDLVNLLISLEFEERAKGSHHIFSKEGINEIINIQPNENNKVRHIKLNR